MGWCSLWPLGTGPGLFSFSGGEDDYPGFSGRELPQGLLFFLTGKSFPWTIRGVKLNELTDVIGCRLRECAAFGGIVTDHAVFFSTSSSVPREDFVY